MGGVDRLDQLIAFYRISLQTKRWNVKMIFHFVEVGLTNIWLEYVRASDVNNISKKRLDGYAFCMEVAEALIFAAGPAAKRKGSFREGIEQFDTISHKQSMQSRPR